MKGENRLLQRELNSGCREELGLTELWFFCKQTLSKACAPKMCADGRVEGGGVVRRMRGNKCNEYSPCARQSITDNNNNWHVLST